MKGLRLKINEKIYIGNISYFLFLICIFTLCFFSFNLQGLAQQSAKGLTITPYSLELTINPGEKVTKKISLSNDTDQTIDIAVSKRNFTANGEEGQVNLTDEETGFSLSSWISTNPQRKTLAPNEKEEFDITITAPNNAEPGGHFGSVVFGTVPQKGLNQTGALLSQEVAALILIKIPGDITENARIESFNPENNFYQNGPVKFDIRVKNDSTVHIKPTGKVIVTDMFGRKFTAPVEGKNVLPEAVRKLQATLKNKLLIGKYTADLSLAYGTQNNALLTGTTTFWAFPVKAGIVGFVILVLIYLMRKRLRKALKALLTGK